MKQLAARINPRPAQPVRTRTRLGLAAAVTATMVAVVGATGGFSSAASTISGATHSVAHATHLTSTPSALVKNASAPHESSGPTSADGQYAVLPTITGFSPGSGAPGSSVTVTGTNFSGASAITSVTLHGTAATFTPGTDSSLTFVVPSGATSGVITLSNAKGSVDSTGTFTVIQTPQFADDTPFSPTDGGVGTAVTLSGSHFTGVTSVTIGGKAAPIDSLTDSEIDTEVPVGAKVGATTISVKNAAGTATASGFTVDSGAPTVSAFSPTSATTGTSVKITGTNLYDAGSSTAASVLFSGAADPATLTEGKTPTKTTLYVDVPADAETGPITVTNDAGQGVSKSSFVVLATPHITAQSPAFGFVGTTITLTGDTFTGATAVAWYAGGHAVLTVPTKSFTVKGDTQITFKAPSSASLLTAGTTYSFQVTGKSGDISDPFGSFYWEARPAIGSLDPTEGAAGRVVAITSAEDNTFLGATTVTFGTKAAKIVSSSPTEIDAVVPAGLVSGTAATATTTVVVGNAAGKSGSTPFTVDNTAPTVKSGPTPGAGEAGDQVTITGTHLNTPDTTVSFLGADSCTVANDDLTLSTTGTGSKAVDTLKFDIPDCAATGLIQIDNGDGVVSTKSFTVYQQPVIEGFSPAYGITGTTVKITGAPGSFAGAYEVDFDSAPAAITSSAISNGNSTITVKVPKTAVSHGTNLTPGNYQITVKVNKADSDLSGNTGNTQFTVVAAPSGLSTTDAGGTAGHQFTLTGQNLVGITAVKFGSVSATFQAVVTGGAIDPTQLLVTVPAKVTSTKVTVFNAATKSGVSTSAVYPILAIKSLSPTSAKHGKATTITIAGSGFKFGGSFAAVTINGEAVTVKSGSSDTKLLVATPTDLTVGTTTVEITNDLGDVTATLKIT